MKGVGGLLVGGVLITSVAGVLEPFMMPAGRGSMPLPGQQRLDMFAWSNTWDMGLTLWRQDLHRKAGVRLAEVRLPVWTVEVSVMVLMLAVLGWTERAYVFRAAESLSGRFRERS